MTRAAEGNEFVEVFPTHMGICFVVYLRGFTPMTDLAGMLIEVIVEFTSCLPQTRDVLANILGVRLKASEYMAIELFD